MFNLLAIGDPLIDTHVQIDESCTECRVQEEHNKYLCLDYGSKIPILNSFQSLGGNAPNVAIGAVKLGLESMLLSTVGRDAHGKVAVSALKKNGVNTSLVTFDKKSTTRYSIVLNYHQERTILSYSDKKKYQWPKKIPPVTWIYYTGLSEGYELIQNNLLTHLKTHPTVKLAINPGSYMLKYALDSLQAMIARADVLIVNLEEAEKISGHERTTEKSEVALLHELLSGGAKEVVITDGQRGAWGGTKEKAWFIQSFPVAVVAKTGAGDAFSSAYLAARFYGHDLPTALRWGTANSCSVIEVPGPHAGLLNKKQIEAYLKQFANIIPTMAA